MAISDTIAAMSAALEDAKDAVEARGGVVGNTGLAGLASEIASIPSSGGN